MSSGTKAMFTLLKSIDDFNDIFSDQEVIVEDFILAHIAMIFSQQLIAL
ncbi:hypothetical protein [Rickettsia endosymbiont of Gonocerus acuteangulatus]